MFTLENYITAFIGSLIAHAALTVYLFVIMDVRGWRILKKLPALLLSPLLAAGLVTSLHTLFPDHSIFHYCAGSCAVLLMCTLWVWWAWQTGFWRAFAVVCMAGVFQVATTCLSQILILNSDLQYAAVTIINWIVVSASAALLHWSRFGHWFRLLLEELQPARTVLFLFALEASMEAFTILQAGILPEYLVPYYVLVLVMAALVARLVIYLAQRFDAARKLAAQRDVIAQQQLYERDLEAIRQEVRAFRHDYKNLLAGLSEQADKGELDQLRTALSELDANFDRRIGEKIQTSTQLGNVRIPQVRSILLTKLAAMGEQGIDCRLEALYPVERVGMDAWDFTRCLGILLDNAAEAAAETGTPWVEVILLAQGQRLSLRISCSLKRPQGPPRISPHRGQPSGFRRQSERVGKGAG